jgi:superfamily II DNA or RNA helicase
MTSRDIRQESTVDRIVGYKANCWIDVVPGFGKTFICIKTIKRALLKTQSLRVLVVVPTKVLKNQWEKSLREHGINSYVVMTINSVVALSTLDTDLCIIDEAHLAILGKKFSTIFQVVKRRAMLAVSGTWSREHKEVINRYLPLADTITEREAIENGWVSKRVERVIEVEMTQENKLLYDNYVEIMDSCFAHFDNSWPNAVQCRTREGASRFASDRMLSVKKEDGSYMNNYELGRYLSTKSNVYMQTLQKRNSLINGSLEKVMIVAQLCRALSDMKIVTFGLATQTVDTLALAVPNSIAYHSNLDSKSVDNEILQKYDIPIKGKGTTTKLTRDKLKELYIRMLDADDVSCIHSAKALDVGLDVQGMNTAITYCRTSNPEKQGQRSSRSSRAEGEEKLSLFIHVVLKDTKDESWFRSATKNKFIRKFNTVDELVADYRREKEYHLENN